MPTGDHASVRTHIVVGKRFVFLYVFGGDDEQRNNLIKSLCYNRETEITLTVTELSAQSIDYEPNASGSYFIRSRNRSTSPEQIGDYLAELLETNKTYDCPL